jgi:ppGpp synthetase/RelA/SpoT-type nucleotidyltranferase
MEFGIVANYLYGLWQGFEGSSVKRVYSDQINRVGKYLDRSNKRSSFKDFQHEVKSHLIRAFERPKQISMVNEVFCRADKDPDNPIKSDKKIAIKLYKWEKSSSAKKPPRPSDVHDIAGVTVVCYYPSDTDEIAKFLERDFQSSSFRIEKMSFRDPVKMKGYRAYHAIAKGQGKFHGLNCEIQIKTLLTMSWGAKTHDLTYKPAGDIDDRLNLYMEKLATVALILDEQSEILKSLITDAWEMDSARRDTARMQMLIGINKSDDSSAQEISAFVQENSNALAVANLNDELPCEVLRLVDDYIEENDYTKEIARVGAVYALTRTYGDKNDWAIELIDDWIEGLEKCSDAENEALVFRSVVCMALGEYEEAVETGRLVVARANAVNKDRAIMSAMSNLAYFLSEAYYHRAFDDASGAGEVIRDSTDDCAKEALQIVDEIRRRWKMEDIRQQAIDTLGAVLIACSGDEEKIREGLSLCNQARDMAEGSDYFEAAKLFFSLHEKRAFRKLLHFN